MLAPETAGQFASMRALSTVIRGALCAFGVMALAGSAAAQDKPRAEPLVTVDWLVQHARDPGLVVLDIRSAIYGGSAETYAKAHIPGAVHRDYDKAGWRPTRNGLPYMLPTVA